MWLAANTAYSNIFLTMTKTDKYMFIVLGRLERFRIAWIIWFPYTKLNFAIPLLVLHKKRGQILFKDLKFRLQITVP